ncbi:hypothetical protein KPL78_22750 [Roseomonas sp. HJA6]|uniref:Uncharacterized protein n=1 Tax=Roseomonas alba TaxID=2846776 RepID=A0ABS7AG19_9PROT|nr:hypothetical protein [Neoroseomonas alba]MBW6400697.1 hypothetical protein [Neoroseomonas alba]
MSGLDLKGLTAEKLSAFEGKNIALICDSGLTDASLNHCAHFVCHALDVGIGMKCGDMTFKTRGKGASIRVDDVFNYCILRGEWDDKNSSMESCLIFVTPENNVKSKTDHLIMGNISKKHIGIHLNGKVWHYSNGKDKVICESVADFKNRFYRNYGSDIGLYYGYRQDI